MACLSRWSQVLDGLLAGKSTDNLRTLLVTAAASDKPGEVAFPDCNGNVGTENCGIGTDIGKSTVQLPLVTVDSLIKEQDDLLKANGGIIDILAIDTEGYDAMVRRLSS